MSVFRTMLVLVPFAIFCTVLTSAGQAGKTAVKPEPFGKMPDGKAVERTVTTGRRDGETVEIALPGGRRVERPGDRPREPPRRLEARDRPRDRDDPLERDSVREQRRILQRSGAGEGDAARESGEGRDANYRGLSSGCRERRAGDLNDFVCGAPHPAMQS